MKHIPVYQPSIGRLEKQYVLDCLNSGWVSSKGEYVDRFEKAFASFVGIEHATSVCNGTVALDVALKALGIGPGDEVIVPTLTYVASVNAIAYQGAVPVFVDSVETSWQMDPSQIEKKITNRTKAIMVVHLYGLSVDMDAVKDIAGKHNLLIVEDCAEAFGGKYKNKHVGTIGDVATFSFYGNKTITTGEGGMVVTKSKRMIDRAVRLKTQGLAGNREYWHTIVGYNYRMTNIQAALGLAQLSKANKFLGRKRAIANRYKRGLKDLVEFQGEIDNSSHAYWMISILVDPRKRNVLRRCLAEKGVETRPVFYPIHLMPMYRGKRGDFPKAELISRRGINLPSWPGMSNEEVDYVIDCIRECLG